MEIAEAAASLIGMIGTGIAIYQWAVINESKKRRSELQFLLAGINHLALAKQITWSNQIALQSQQKTQDNLEAIRLATRSRDDFGEVSGLVSALEGVIDVDSSASRSIQVKALEQAKANKELRKLAEPSSLPANSE